MRKVELLAPCGNMKCAYAAVQNGADAVYFGGGKFSARASAQNFGKEEVIELIKYCHTYGVRTYAAVNTLIKNKEINEALDYIDFLQSAMTDGIIIQDIGLAELVKKNFPNVKLHASTQMTIHNLEGALLLQNAGFKRIVLSRELNVSEIKNISQKLNIETEIFIHGALCVSYSGQCLMSSILGGRSGNRGRCAQPCRLPYDFIDEKNKVYKNGYILSPKDICTFQDLKKILNSGAASLKIEGRMKKPEYVGIVVSSYRKAIDAAINNSYMGKEESNNEYNRLLQAFNREGFSKGYFFQNDGKDMMAYSNPKNTGILLGKVKNNKIQLNCSLSVGDGIKNNNSGFTVSKIILNNNEVQAAGKNDIVSILPQRYKNSDILYKTLDTKLENEIDKTFEDKYQKKISLPLSVVFKLNSPIILKTEYLGNEFIYKGEVVQKAINKPIKKEELFEKLKKSMETPFIFTDIQCEAFEEGFLPVSCINSARRNLITLVHDYVLLHYNDTNHDMKKIASEEKNETKFDGNKNIPSYIIVLNTKEQFEAAMKLGMNNIAINIYESKSDFEYFKKILQNDSFYIKIPSIIKNEFESITNFIESNMEHITGIITSNLGIINYFKNRINIIGDYKLNIFNTFSKAFFDDKLSSLCVSAELNKTEIKELIKKTSMPIQVLIYGRIELMVSEYCAEGCIIGNKSLGKQCSKPCMNNNKYYLKDRYNKKFLISTDKFCRMHLYNSYPLNLIEYNDEITEMGAASLRFDFTDEDYEQTFKMLEGFKNKKYDYDSAMYTKGHYRRGVE